MDNYEISEPLQPVLHEEEKKARQETVSERNKSAKLYFEFDTKENRDRAMEILYRLRNEGHEHDDQFLYFIGCTIDPNRTEVGVEISFSKNPLHIRETFEKLLADNGLVPSEKYETLDGKPV